MKNKIQVISGGLDRTLEDRLHTIIENITPALEDQSNCTIVVNFSSDGNIFIASDPAVSYSDLEILLIKAARVALSYELLSLLPQMEK